MASPSPLRDDEKWDFFFKKGNEWFTVVSFFGHIRLLQLMFHGRCVFFCSLDPFHHAMAFLFHFFTHTILGRAVLSKFCPLHGSIVKYTILGKYSFYQTCSERAQPRSVWHCLQTKLALIQSFFCVHCSG